VAPVAGARPRRRRWFLGELVIAIVAVASVGAFPAQAIAAGGDLWTFGSATMGDTGLAMMAGTSPSITALSSGGYEIAYQGTNGDLWLYGTTYSGDTGEAMMAGTSPSITAIPGDYYQVAYQGRDGELWEYGQGGTGDVGYAMAHGTSPSITSLTGGGEIAYEGSNGNLWEYGSATTGNVDTGATMLAGTSPSISQIGGNDFQIAYQGADGDLWEYGNGGDGNVGDGMMAGTSPSIISLTGGGEIAFQANTGHLWEFGSDGSGDTGVTMLAGTSPSMTAIGGTDYQIAYQGSDGELWEYGDGGTGNTGDEMAAATSPSIISLTGGGEIAFQGSAPANGGGGGTGGGGGGGGGGTGGSGPGSSTGPPVITSPVTVTVPTPRSPVKRRGHSGRRQLKVKITASWTWSYSHSRLGHLRFGRLPHGAQVTTTCRGRGCPLRAVQAGTHELARLLAFVDGLVYIAGDRIYITVTAPGYLPERAELLIRDGELPTARVLAAPGSAAKARTAGLARRQAVSSSVLVSRPWTLRTVRDHGRVVVISYSEGGCWGPAQVRVAQKRTTVTIELLQPYSGGPGVACPQFLLVRDISVRLKVPLGRRHLIHAPLGATPGS